MDFDHRLKIVLLLGAGVIVVYGGVQIYQETRYHEPIVISYDDFMKQKPTAGWFHIKDCALNVPGIVHYHANRNGGSVNDYYIDVCVPVMSAKKRKGETFIPPFPFLVQTDASDILYTYTQYKETHPISEAVKRENKKMDTTLFGHHFAAPDLHDRTEFVQKNKGRLYPKRDLEGIISSGAAVSVSDRGLSSVDEDTVILVEGKKPSPVFGVKILALGLILLIGQMIFFFSRRER